MRREFYHTHTVRYDECNCYGYLTPASFLRYTQDIAILDVEDAQLTGDGHWVVKKTALSFTIPVRAHTRLELKTYGLGSTRVTAMRGYEAYIAGEQRDKPAISAHTLWVYLDSRGRPIRIPPGTAQIWQPDSSSSQQSDAPLPAFPEGTPCTTTSVVHFSDIDSMLHLNNASAVEILDNAAWEVYAKEKITPPTAWIDALSYEIEYVDSPRFGEALEIQSWFLPFPSAGQEFSRFQQIIRGGKTMVRAHSRWRWRVSSDPE
jgi:acyl-CoA thioesterase FadM